MPCVTNSLSITRSTLLVHRSPSLLRGEVTIRRPEDLVAVRVL
jgi:hypothetical protein